MIDRKITLKNLGYYHYRIGTSLLMVGELVQSLEEYRQAYNVHVDLLAGARDDPELIRTAALDALTLGNGSYLLGRREAAEEYFRQSLDLIEQFDRARKGAPDARFLLASYRSVVGLYRFRIGQREAARREYQSARDLLVALKAADPQNIYYRSELVVLLGRLGRLEETEQHPGAARSAFEEAYRLAEENYRVDEKNDLRRMALLKLLPRVGQVERALEMAERMAAGPKVDAELWVELACCYAQCARSLPPEKAEPRGACQIKAVDAVRSAIRGGFRDKIALEIEPDLDPIRQPRRLPGGAPRNAAAGLNETAVATSLFQMSGDLTGESNALACKIAPQFFRAAIGVGQGDVAVRTHEIERPAHRTRHPSSRVPRRTCGSAARVRGTHPPSPRRGSPYT